MHGRMFKDVIVMDDEKILAEGKFAIEDIYYTIRKTFKENGFLEENTQVPNELRFYGVNGADDMEGMMNVIIRLINRKWFTENCKSWLSYENSFPDEQDSFAECDMLATNKKYARIMASCNK
jgi:hypothetical protein